MEGEEFRVIYVPTFRLGDGNNTVKWNQLSIMGTLYLMDSIILQTIQRYIIWNYQKDLKNAENTSILFLNVFKTDCVIWFLNSQLFFLVLDLQSSQLQSEHLKKISSTWIALIACRTYGAVNPMLLNRWWKNGRYSVTQSPIIPSVSFIS